MRLKFGGIGTDDTGCALCTKGAKVREVSLPLEPELKGGDIGEKG
jgi:hypothetical protein